MKKFIIILGMCLVLCGCGCSKEKKPTKQVEKSAIGNEDVSFNLNITCGEITKNSNITLNKDNTAKYELYECNNDVLELTTGYGTYKVSGSNVIITGNYSEVVNVTVKDSKAIEVNYNNIKQTLTK